MIQVPVPLRSDDRSPHTSFPMMWINPSLVQEIKETREVVNIEPENLEAWTPIVKRGRWDPSTNHYSSDTTTWWRPHPTECILIWWGQKDSGNGLRVAWSPARLANELKVFQYKQVSMMGR